jgi:ribosomal protein L37AE/L43A
MSHTIGGLADKKSRICPKCKRGLVSRVARKGFLEENMFSRLGFYPWECSECRNRLMLKGRGEKIRRRRRTQDNLQATTEPGRA